MYAVRVENEYVGLMGRHVAEGQSIMPGAPLMDIMTPDGIVETIFSEGWGVVAHIEGARVFFDANNNNDPDDGDTEEEDEDGEGGQTRSSSGGASAVFPKGSVICHIVSRFDGGSTKKAGLHPRPAPSVRFRRLMGVALR